MVKKTCIVILTGIMIVSLSACDISSSDSENNRYTATVEADNYNIVSEISGKVIDTSVIQGSYVKDGDKVETVDATSYLLQQKEAEAGLTIAVAKQGEVPANADDNTKNSANASVEQAQVALDLAKLQVDKCNIKSSVAGTVLDIYVHKGEMVGIGMNIAKVMDSNNKYIEVYIDESKRNDISENKSITLYSNDKKIGDGKIIYISKQSEFTPKNTETKDEKGNTVFKVKISLNEIKDVAVGSMVDAEIK